MTDIPRDYDAKGHGSSKGSSPETGCLIREAVSDQAPVMSGATSEAALPDREVGWEGWWNPPPHGEVVQGALTDGVVIAVEYSSYFMDFTALVDGESADVECWKPFDAHPRASGASVSGNVGLVEPEQPGQSE